jgi:D-glycero-D-manno-heptose 1,7-bisphosphate phosphatase
VFLDRDGVLNRLVMRDGRGLSPRRLGDFRLLPGAGGAVRALQGAGFLVIVVTNQPDVARGFLDAAELGRMHEILAGKLGVDAIYTCTHDDQDGCCCRKPQPGLLLRAGEEWSVDLSASYLIGDSWKDVGAGRAAGCRTVLVSNGVDHRSRGEDADFVVRSLKAAVSLILPPAPGGRTSKPGRTRPLLHS